MSITQNFPGPPYVVSGKFEFTIGDETRIVTAGDTLLKEDGVVHGCTCLEAGKLLDIFHPMRGHGRKFCVGDFRQRSRTAL